MINLIELNQSYTDRINADEAPTRSEILSSNLSQSQKDSLVALITSKETERRDATRNVNYNELIGSLMGGDGGGISENELNDIDMSDAQRADVRRQLDDWEEAEAERLRIENETATRKEREALEVKNYNELITRFMGGDAVSEYEIGNMQLNDSQRSDLMARFTTYSREQERVQADADRVTLQQTNFDDLMGRIMNNEDIEELTCINLARMWDTEDATVPWDWRRSTQLKNEERKGESEGRESKEHEEKGGGG